MSNSCLYNYIGGVALIGAGAGMAFGFAGLLMAGGFALVLGAVTEFMLTKIRAISGEARTEVKR